MQDGDGGFPYPCIIWHPVAYSWWPAGSQPCCLAQKGREVLPSWEHLGMAKKWMWAHFFPTVGDRQLCNGGRPITSCKHSRAAKLPETAPCTALQLHHDRNESRTAHSAEIQTQPSGNSNISRRRFLQLSISSSLSLQKVGC